MSGDAPAGPGHRPARTELGRLLRLALPVAAAQVLTMLVGMVDTVMLGRLSVEALAAASLAGTWVFGTSIVAMGVVMGMDPIVTRAHGSGDGRAAALVLHHGTVLALGLGVPLGLLWTATEPFLLAFGQDPALARAGGRYALAQAPSAPFFLGFLSLRLYLQGREMMRPAMWVMGLANLFNVAANEVLIFGAFGLPGLGIVGAGLATSLTRVVSLGLLVLFVGLLGLHRGAWVRPGREALDPAALRRILALGVPVGLQMGLEVWAFSGSSLVAGHLDTTAVAAHHVALNLAALSFMMPLGISQAVVTRVGNLLGAGRPDAARRAARVGLATGAGVMGASAVVFVLFREDLPRLYTSDPGVVALAASVLPIAAAFQIFDGTQVVGSGVLRGMGRTRPAAWFNFFGYWVLGLPVGAALAFRGGLGLAGIWWGLCLGLGTVAVLLVGYIHFRGPGAGIRA